MNFNKYGEVINGNETYKTIAKYLTYGESALIGWTDEADTHYDILFNYNALSAGFTQGGIKGDDLFISIMRVGAFGFKTDDKKCPGYIAEKLFNGRLDKSVEKVTELINGVIKELNNEC